MIQRYTNVKSPQITQDSSFIHPETWLSWIRTGRYADSVIRYRESKDASIKESLPCVTWNFMFHTRRADSNIIGSTGFMFFDIDNKDNAFDVTTLNRSRVYAAYRSLSGTGYHVIARVDEGVNIRNFDLLYPNIATWLNLTESYDRNAAKKTQPCVISADSELFVNTQCEIYNTSNLVDSLEFDKSSLGTPMTQGKRKQGKVSTDTNIKEGEDILASVNTFEKNADGTYTAIRFSNTDELQWTTQYNKQREFHSFNPKREFVIASIPNPKAIKYSVHGVLLAYAATILWLNPWMHKQQLEYWVEYARANLTRKTSKINGQSKFQTKSIIDTLFKQLEEGTLEPPNSAKQMRRVVFNPGITKPKNWQQIIGQVTQQETLQRIYECIETWTADDGKLNVKRIREKLKMTSRTIYKYIPELQDYLETRKQELKQKETK